MRPSGEMLMKAVKEFCKNCRVEVIEFRGRLWHIDEASPWGKEWSLEIAKTSLKGCTTPVV